MLTRWPVTLRVDVNSDDLDAEGVPRHDALLRWLDEAWAAYLARCTKLRREIRRGRVRLDMRPLRVGPHDRVVPGETLLLAVAMTELRPSAIELALRVRALGANARLVLDGRRSIVFVDDASGRLLEIPQPIRDELIAVEAAATEFS